jgi:glycosyltransferase involved in cell wall biosynthesis
MDVENGPPDPEPDAASRPVTASVPHLRVVQVVRSDAFAGVERYMCQVSNGLTARGHHLTVIGGDPGRMQAELSGQIEYLPATTVLGTARALAGRHQVDIVHVHMTAAEGAAWLARPFQRAPIVATRHFPGRRGTGTVARSLARVVCHSIARDVAISEFVARGIDGPSVLLYNAVPDRPPADLEAPVVLMLQRLTEEKRPELGLRIWAASGLGKTGWRLVIAGTGDRRGSMTDLAGVLGVDDSVDFVGQRADTDALLDQSSVVLATAPEEPFGLSVVEAMAHGVPVVAADGGAHAETVAEPDLLFAPDDADAGSRALVRLAEDPDLRRQLGGRLRRRQQEMFSIRHHLDGLERLYAEVVDESARSTRR